MTDGSPRHTYVTEQQAVIHALFRKHRSMSIVARQLGLCQIRVREALVQHERNTMRDAGMRPPPLKEMLRGDVVTRFGVPRSESGGRPAKHVQLESVYASKGGRIEGRAIRSTRTYPVPASGTTRFIITAVDADAPVHQGFWTNLRAYASSINATVAVVRTGSVATKHDMMADYRDLVVNERITIGECLDVVVDDIPPQRLSRPLEAARHNNKAKWTLVPHRAIQLETLPRIRADGLKAQLTTGVMTLPVDGTRSHRREVGAVIAEVSASGGVYCRHLLSDLDGDGAFHDLHVRIANGVVRSGGRVEALTFGDVHHAHLDPHVAASTWGIGARTDAPKALVDMLRPRNMVFHDVCDFEARSAYDARDHHKRFAQMIAGGGDVRAELAATAAFLADTRRSWSRSVVVGSNHDMALLRWLREQDFREDHRNAIFYLETSLRLHRWLAEGRPADGLFEHTLRSLTCDGLRGVRFLRPNESLKLAGVEASIHGHLGADGRPGDVRFFERLGIRATLGHTHRPTTRDGIYCSGVCNTELAYARGTITAWATGHVVTYPSGSRQHLIFDGGRFHA
ncbi:hypothetical protein M9978_17520 [Sphingomonas sp. MG17]|uniref:Uncharacterized protein n=1 Tax=Sphingomonas tagetis TaxID=2949092 RepID=A0A9X2KQW5_9SPHN|nr:hypothetical protein [Sphingomonas tagetis]MCP3732223.1 hypothetical protein [Sphingomonas tagetis]